jgi:tetratricopeptide (TPR) repeat protein
VNPIEQAAAAFPAFGLAVAYHEAGDLAAARAAYLQMMDQPQLTGLCLHQLGVLAAARGDHRVAADLFSRTLAIAPLPMVYANLHAAQDLVGDRAGATATLIDLGCFLQLRKLHADAVPVYRKVLERDPLSYPAYANLGNACAWLGELPQAAQHLSRAVVLWSRVSSEASGLPHSLSQLIKGLSSKTDLLPDIPAGLPHGPIQKIEELLTTLGKVFGELEMPDAALACFRQSVALSPGYALGHWNLAAELLCRMDFEAGWAAYEWRWRWPEFPEAHRALGLPVWLGEPLAGKRIYVWGEQGLGDSMQFAPLAAQLPALGAEVILEVPVSLVRLLAHSFHGLRVVPRPDSPERLSFDERLDYVVPLMSLPLRLGLRPQALPLARAYLRPPEGEAPAGLQQHGTDGRPRVGLVWAGQPRHTNDHRRSLPASALTELLRVDTVSWFSLTVGARQADIAGMPRIVDLAPALGDFADTARAVERLELVITVDTAVAHLAGAMGRPVWLLLPKVGDWRWGRSGNTTPWYPATRIFRQSRLGDWSDVLEQVAQALGQVRANADVSVHSAALP